MRSLAVSRALRGPVGVTAALAMLLIVIGGLLAPPAHAAGPRPPFQIPFRCSERWKASTRWGHAAIDWNYGVGSDDLGRPVTASAAGIAKAKYHYAYGYYVDIDHGGGWVTRYAHLLRAARADGPVAQGEKIGLVGSTGSSTSAHLHWEQRANGVRQSPLVADGTTLRPDGRTYTSRNCLRRDPFVSADIDGDGIDDMAARFVAADGSSRIRTIRGRASRSLERGPTLALNAADLPPTSLLSLGDTDGDSRADLNAAYRHDGGVKFVSFAGRRDGSFAARRTRHVAGSWRFSQLNSVRAADVTGDNVADLVARFIQRDGDSVVRTLVGRQDTAAVGAVRTRTIDNDVLPRPAQVALGDTNGDDRSDLNAVIATGSTVRLVSFYGRGSGEFERRRTRYASSTWNGRRIKTIRVGDVDKDGIADFVVRFLRSDAGSTMRIVAGRAARELSGPIAVDIAAADLPADAQLTLGNTNGTGGADLNVAARHSGDVRFSSFYGQDSAALGERRTRYVGGRWQFHRLC